MGARRPLLGTKIDHVLLDADADTIMMRGELPVSPARIVIPIVNPKQGLFAIEVAEAVAGDHSVIELVHVGTDREATARSAQRVMQTLFDAPDFSTTSPRRSLPVTMHKFVDASPLQAIFRASSGADLVIVGAAGESWMRRQAFTPFHAQLAALHSGPMLLVKRRSGAARFASQRTVEFFKSKEPAQ
jgi:nucleotide-binding universal stress UspA family protein